MESSDSSSFCSFKSKKLLNSTSKPPSSAQTLAPDHNQWSSKTPEKPTPPLSRTRNRGVALSIKEVKQIAEKLRKPDHRPDPISSARDQIVTRKPKNAVSRSIKLPEKYEGLVEFFDSLDSSIRLIRLKGSASTFTNICPKIECLTDRRFSHSHLAKLKFILPEAIVIKKVLVLDERTNCMKPDLHITLNVDAIENSGKLKSESGNSHLRKVFRSRLLDFFKAHPEGDDIPEETLPEPFNQSKQDLHSNISKSSNSSLPAETSIDPLTEQQPAVAAHLSRSFRKHFSQKVSNHEAENTHQKPSKVSLQPPVLPVSEPRLNQCSSNEEITASAVLSPVKFSSKPTTSKKCLVFGASPARLPPSRAPATPSKEIDSAKNEDFSSIGTASIQGTPAKLASTPAKLMTVTPALQPPKRCWMSPDDDSTSSPNKLVRRPPRTRSLIFDTPVKNAKVEDGDDEIGGLSVDSDIFEILPKNLLQSIREKERKAIEEQDPAISRAKRRREMIASLPKLFNMIHFLFQSIKRSVITKEELIHKIIASHCDIVDRREVEEQLILLQELVPEWISEKLASSGDFLLCINKTSSPELIHARLAEAK